MSNGNSGFSDVDQSRNPTVFVDCLDSQYKHNSILRSHKQRALDISDIQSGHIVLDAGCGTGVDAAKMAEKVGESGHVYGIDFSHEMIMAARERVKSPLPITFQQGSIYQLDFEDNYFDRSRSDKTFQHLHNPKAALKELLRVTKSGGKIIISDPDHDSLIIDTPFADITHRFVRFRSEQMAQGGIAHQLYVLFKENEMTDVRVEPLTAVYTNYDEKKVSSPYLEEIWVAHEHGIVTEEEARIWANYLQDAIQNDRFLCLQTYMITSGYKPK